MAYCENCGMQIADDAKFCENCGAPHMQAANPGAGQAQQNSYGNQQTQQSSNGNQQAQQYSYGNQQAQNTYNSYDSGTSAQQQTSYGSTSSYGQDTGSYSVTPAMGFQEAIQTCFSKYATFNGRARRSEYWYFFLFNALVSIVLGIVGNMIFGAPKDGGANILQGIYSVAVFIPGLAVAVRRLHDIGKSGLWFLINLVPCIGQIVLIVFYCMDSEPGENQYGVSPKYPGA